MLKGKGLNLRAEPPRIKLYRVAPPPPGLLCKINTKNKFRNPTIFKQFTHFVTCNFAERKLRLTVDKTARKAVHENQCKYHYSAGNNFSYLAGHVSFQIFSLVGHITNLIGH